MKRFTIAVLLTFALSIPVNAIEAKQPRPLTTLGLAKSLLTLAEKAEGQGMRAEAQAIMSIIPTILTGTPADRIKPAAALCDTDMDCARKFGGRR